MLIHHYKDQTESRRDFSWLTCGCLESDAARFGISTNSVATTSTTGVVPHVTKGRDIAFDLDDGLEIFLTVDINRHH